MEANIERAKERNHTLFFFNKKFVVEKTLKATEIETIVLEESPLQKEQQQQQEQLNTSYEDSKKNSQISQKDNNFHEIENGFQKTGSEDEFESLALLPFDFPPKRQSSPQNDQEEKGNQVEINTQYYPSGDEMEFLETQLDSFNDKEFDLSSPSLPSDFSFDARDDQPPLVFSFLFFFLFLFLFLFSFSFFKRFQCSKGTSLQLFLFFSFLYFLFFSFFSSPTITN